MSIRIMCNAWQTELRNHTTKLVLLALADNANDEGFCWPGLGTLARKCDLTERCVRSQIRKLEEMMLLQTEVGGGHKSNRYQLKIPPPTPEYGSSLPRNAVPGTPEYGSSLGGTVFPPGGNAVPGNHHKTVKEPSTNHTPLPPNGGNGDDLCYEEILLADRLDAIRRWFKRRETTQWKKKELDALKETDILGTVAEDFEALDRFYSFRHPRGKDYRRRKLVTLLNNWPGEIDRANRWCEENPESEQLGVNEDGTPWLKPV